MEDISLVERSEREVVGDVWVRYGGGSLRYISLVESGQNVGFWATFGSDMMGGPRTAEATMFSLLL